MYSQGCKHSCHIYWQGKSWKILDNLGLSWIRLDISAGDYSNFLSHEHVLTVLSQTHNSKQALVDQLIP